MAIEVTTFNYPSVPDSNIDEVYDWLVENASEYFQGGIVKDTSTKCLMCYVDEPGGDSTPRIVIPFKNNSANATGYFRTRYAPTNWGWNPNGTNHSGRAFSKAAKTQNGIALLAYTTGSTWYVAKTETGSVCFYGIGAPAYNSNTFGMYACDLENDITPTSRGTYSTVTDLVDKNRYIAGGAATAIVPFAFRCGTYSTSMLYTPFTQATFFADLQTVAIDGQEYVYDGLVALKG